MTEWRPLLRGAASRKALELAFAVCGPPVSGRDHGRAGCRRGQGGTNARWSLADGAAGEAMLAAALAALPGRAAYAQAANDRMSRALEATRIDERDSSFFSGFPGVAWCGSRLEPGNRSFGEFCSSADEAAEALVSVPLWEGEYDLVNGLVGYGVYGLDRLPRPSAVRTVREIVRHLARSAEPVDGGLAWRTPARRLPPALGRRRPSGHFDVGMAHGVPGAIAFLAQVVAARLEANVANGLLEGGVAWLLAQERRQGESRFPFHVVPGEPAGDCRSAWCYGDPGVAAGLLLAARLAQRPSWEREALEIAWRAAKRDPGSAGVTEAGLCHGAAGLGHVFNRLYQATGDEMLRRTAVFWFEATLAMMAPRPEERGEARRGEADRGARSGLDRSFLTGTAGVGLALFAAATPFEPVWDRALLLSSAVMPRRARRSPPVTPVSGDPSRARRRRPGAPRESADTRAP